MSLKTFWLSVLLSLISCFNLESDKELPKTIRGKVTGIKDGDTIDILYDGNSLSIRFAHIDCPELRASQPFGKAAKQFTSDLCFGDTVAVQNENEFDGYGRLIGVIINTKGDTVNLELIKAGLAWHYKKYSDDKDYGELESKARLNKIGLWSEENPVAPWNWRK